MIDVPRMLRAVGEMFAVGVIVTLFPRFLPTAAPLVNAFSSEGSTTGVFDGFLGRRIGHR